MPTQSSYILAHLDDDPLELKRFARELKKHVDPAVKPRDDTKPRDDNKKIPKFNVHSFTHSADFLKFISDIPKIDFCILDIVLSSEDIVDGISLIQSIKTRHPQCVVVVSSFNDDTNWILKSLSLQADDFFSKKIWPNDIAQRLVEIQKFVQIKHGFCNVEELSFESKNKQDANQSYSKIAGATLKSVENRVKLILKSEARCVLIEGESGTGKEVVADLFEYHTKGKGSFVRINCGSLAQNLLESELFGYKKGAFTGALQDKIGFIESAHNGFLFLDEISSLPLNAQIALLRVIENQEIVRLGETVPRKINVRFVCASNVNLEKCVAQNTFRNDLWQRFREVEIYLPPLRERKSEISDLIDFFCSQFTDSRYVLDSLARQVLCSLDWRDGNVRELRNTLRAMTEFAQNGVLGVSAIPSRVFSKIS